MHFCFLTCEEKPNLTEDDAFLKAALEKRGHAVSTQVWSAPDVAWGKYHTCVIRSTWDYHRRLPDFLSWLRSTAKNTVIVNSPDIVSWNASKEYLLDLQGNGLPIVPTAVFDDAATALAAAQELLHKEGAFFPEASLDLRALRYRRLARGAEDRRNRIDRAPALFQMAAGRRRSCGGSDRRSLQKIKDGL